MRISGNNNNIKISTQTSNKQDRRVTNKILDESTLPSTISQTTNTTKPSTITPTINPKNQQQLNQPQTKIQTCLRTITNLQSKTTKLQSQLEYYHNIEQWLNKIIKSQQKSSTNLKSLMSANSKLNVLEKQAIFAVSRPVVKENIEGEKGRCSRSEHLGYLLRDRNGNKEKIAQLMKVRQELYVKIQANLKKQQPYLHQKIMKKIRKQISKQTKLQAITQLKKHIKQKQTWLKNAKQQIQQKIDDKLIQQKLTNNLQKMKQIMNKKILNDQYICEITKNQNNIEKNLQRFRKVGKDVVGVIRGEIENMGDCVQEELEELEKGRIMRKNYVEFDQIFMGETMDLIRQGESYLVQPLGSEGAKYLQEQYERLQKQLNKLTNKIY